VSVIFKFRGSRKFTIHCGLVFEFMFLSATLSTPVHLRAGPGKHRLGTSRQSVTRGRPAVFLHKIQKQSLKHKCRMADSFHEEAQQTVDATPDPNPEHDADKDT